MIKRPWISLFVCLLLGEFLGANILPVSIIISSLCLVVSINYIFRCNKKDNLLHLFLLLFFVLGYFLSIFNQAKEREFIKDKIVKNPKYIDIKVKNIIEKERSILIEADKIICKLKKDEDLEIDLGDELRLFGEFEELEEKSNEYQFDKKEYYLSKKIFISFKARKVETLKKSTSLLNKIRKYIKKTSFEYLKKDDAGFVIALLLGDKTYLNKEIYDLFKRTGVLHILAISGLHTSLIGLLLYKILKKKFKFSYISSFVFASMSLIIYSLLIVDSIGVFRSSLMLAFLFFANLRGKDYDILSVLCFVASIFLLINTRIYKQTSFILSFSMIFFIYISSYVSRAFSYLILGYDRTIKRKNKMIIFILSTIFLNILSLPLIAYFFYYIPIYSILLNLLILPLLSILFLSSIFFQFKFPFIQYTFISNIEFILSFYYRICNFFDKLSIARILVGKPSVFKIFFYYLFLIFAIIILNFNIKKISTNSFKTRKNIIIKRCLTFFACVICSLCILFIKFTEKDKVLFMDVGQGDGIYLNIDELNILMDFGSTSNKNLYLETLKPLFLQKGIREVDFAFISHADSDHYSAIVELAKDDEIKLRKVVLPIVAREDEDYEKLKKVFLERDIELVYFERRDRINFKNSTFTCLSPSLDYLDKETNSQSIVVLYEKEDKKILFTGDMTKDVEEEFLQNKKILEKIKNVDIIKIAHHGSFTSSTYDFLYKLNPSYAIISYGKRNKYGHPHKEVIKNLRDLEVQIYETALDGQITVELDSKIKIDAYKRK